MLLRLQRCLLATIAVFLVSFAAGFVANAELINYVHDGMNQLIRIYYDDGKVIEYSYDNAGNRVSKTISQITDSNPPTTTVSPAGGIFASAQSVSLSCSDGTGAGCGKIYYTTDGSTPTTSSMVYSSPVNISTTTILKFFAKDLVGNSESVNTQIYTFDTIAPTTTLSPSGGIYNTPQSVTLTCNDGSGSGCDKIYYTTDGSIPTTSSAVYLNPINISATTILMFFAKDLAGNSESIKNQTYTISTSMVVVQLKDSNGNPLGGGVIQYYSNGWKDFGTTDANGRASKDLLPGSYTFSMTYAFTRQEKSQNTLITPNVAFQTKAVTLQLKDSTGALMDAGTVQYYSGGWRNIGSTSSGQISKELLPGTYSFSMTYAYGRQEKSQNVANDPNVVFQTRPVSVQLKDSTGALMDTGTVQYYAGGWRNIGDTSGGQITRELLPGTYSFSMTYAYGRQEKSQNIANDPNVVFQTRSVSVQLKDSTGVLMDTGRVQYYAGGWRNIGDTSGGQITRELLPGTYSFSMTYAYGRQEKSQNIASDPNVVFQTRPVSVQLKDSTGVLMDTGTVQYYAGGWRNIGDTSGGQITRELLPGTYSFSMTYAYGRQEKSQNIVNDPSVSFITGQIYSDSNSCINYYAGGWRLFFQNMELLPVTYSFHFNDGTPDKTYTIITSTVNHIH
jgi:YD repeat-containing protein